MPNIGMETHISDLSTARSRIPTASLHNQTATFASTVKSTSGGKMLVFPFTCGEVTIDWKWFFSRWSKQSSVLSKRFTKVHFTAETDVPETAFWVRRSCQSAGNERRGSTT